MKCRRKPKFLLNKLISNNKGGRPNIRNQGEFLVWNFLPAAKDLTQKEWIREKGIAKKILTEDYSNFKFEFWLQFTLPFPIPSLAYFRKSNVKKEVKSKYYKFLVLKKIDFTPAQKYIYTIPPDAKVNPYMAPNNSKLNSFFKDEKKEK